MFKNIFQTTFSRTEKIILTIFFALFVVPAIIWSPVWNNVSPFRGPYDIGDWHSLASRPSWDTIATLAVIQFIGILLTFLFLVIKRKKIANKGIRWLSIIIVLPVVAMLFIIASAWVDSVLTGA